MKVKGAEAWLLEQRRGHDLAVISEREQVGRAISNVVHSRWSAEAGGRETLEIALVGPCGYGRLRWLAARSGSAP